jgi:2Fe-2S ferredoxin
MLELVIQNFNNKSFESSLESQTLLNLAQDHYMDWMHACGGKGRCTTCRVEVIDGSANLGPITEAEQFTYNVNVSATGEWLGRSVVAAGLEFSFQVEHVSETFADGEWALFLRHCNEGDATFYVAPKPVSYPKEVAYAWPSDTVRANRAFPKKEISRTIELQCNGYKRP